jgi:hypothetical protein
LAPLKRDCHGTFACLINVVTPTVSCLDNAYIADFEKGIEFMLTAVIYCNEDQIFNDDKYDYEKIGFPFMANLGKTIFEYELDRKRTVRPDLSRFEVEYDK